MMPTEFMAAAVAMLTGALAQLLYFRHKFFTCHLVKIRIHNKTPFALVPRPLVRTLRVQMMQQSAQSEARRDPDEKTRQEFVQNKIMSIGRSLPRQFEPYAAI